MATRLRASRCIIIAAVCLLSVVCLQFKWITQAHRRAFTPLDWHQATDKPPQSASTDLSSGSNTPHSLTPPTSGIFSIQRPKPLPRIQQKGDSYSLSKIGEAIFGSDGQKFEVELARKRVKATFLRSWNGYLDQAWPHDELAPIHGGFRDAAGGVSLTLIGALDTLWVMDLKEEFRQAVEQIGNVTFTRDLLNDLPSDVIATQVLGGLLGAYDVSQGKHQILLDQARNVGELLLEVFNTTNRMPTKYIKFQHGEDGVQYSADEMTVPELSSFGLEMIRLAQLTGDSRYFEPVSGLADVLGQWQTQTTIPGLLPYFVDATGCKVGLDGRCHVAYLSSPQISDDIYSLGAGAGSVYSAFLKQHILLGQQDDRFRDMFKRAVKVIKEKLMFQPLSDWLGRVRMTGNIIVDKSKKNDEQGRTVFEPQVSRSTCSSGAMFALGSRVFRDSWEFPLAAKLTEGCVWAHDTSRSGLSPSEFMMIECTGIWCGLDTRYWWRVLDIRMSKNFKAENYMPTFDFSLSKKSEYHRRQDQTSFRRYDPLQSKTISRPGSVLAHQDFARDRIWDEGLSPGMTDILSREYDLQAETLESIFTLYRISGSDDWLWKGWRVFEAIDRMTASRYGNARLLDTTKVRDDRVLLDVMPHCWLSATLKYAYLLFTDRSFVSLDDYVFNSEGHPFRLPR